MALTDQKKRKGQQPSPINPTIPERLSGSPSSLVQPARPELANAPGAVQAGARMRDTATRMYQGARQVQDAAIGAAGGYARTLAAPLVAAGQGAAQLVQGGRLAPGQTPQTAAAAAVPGNPAGALIGGARSAVNYGRNLAQKVADNVPAAAQAAIQAGPPAELAGTGAKEGDQGTFTGSNGVVRVLQSDGSMSGRGSNQAGTPGGGSFQTMSGAPVAANGQPMLGGQPGQSAPQRTLSPASVQYGADVASAQAQNLATNARANQVTARTFGAPDVEEMQRRFKNSLGGKMTRSERQGLIAANQQALGGIIGSQQAAQAGAEGAIAQQNQTTGQLQLGEQAGQNRLAERALSIDGQMGLQEQQAGLQASAPQQFVDASGNAYVRNGTSLAPITGADGQQARVALPEQAGQVTPAIQYEALNKRLEVLQDPQTAAFANASPESRKAYEQQLAEVQGQLAQFEGRGGGAAPAAAQGVPKGYTVAGKTKDGKTVYRDASGKTFIGE